jgi:tetratricopeptide (TPR) repeat protein
MANIHQERGELERALELYREALSIAEQLEDLQGRGATLQAMANTHQRRGEVERAVELYREALHIFERLGDRQRRGAALAMRGKLLAGTDQKELALRDFIDALASLADVSTGATNQVMAIVRGMKANLGDEEFKGLWRNVTGQQEVPDWLAEPQRMSIDRLLTLANRQEEAKDWRGAVETYSEALSLLASRTMSDDGKRRHAETAFRLGVCLRQDGQWGAAVERLQEAFRLFKGLKDFHGQGLAYLESARAYQAMNSYDLAMLYYKDASRLFKRAGDEVMAAVAYEDAGNLQVYLRALPGAIGDLEEAARLYRAANIPSRAAIVDQNLELARHSHE